MKKAKGLNSNFKLNKKGQLVNILLFIVMIAVIFGMAIMSYFSYNVLKEVNDDFQSQPDFYNETKAITGTLANSYPAINDTFVIIVLMIGWLLAIVTAYYSVENPILLVIMIIVIVVLVIVTAILSNGWEDISADFPSYASSFPVTNYVLNNYALVFIVIFLSCLAVIGFRRF